MCDLFETEHHSAEVANGYPAGACGDASLRRNAIVETEGRAFPRLGGVPAGHPGAAGWGEVQVLNESDWIGQEGVSAAILSDRSDKASLTLPLHGAEKGSASCG